MAGPLVVGTIVWVLITIIGGYFVMREVSSQSSELKRESNKTVALVSIILVGVQLWMMWITCYMHQMYPLVQPKIQF